MQLDFAFLCDSAQEAAGKIHALGVGFDTIVTAAVPLTHPMLTVVVQLHYSVAEAGDKPISIRLIDADGHDIVTPVGQTVPFPAPEERMRNTARLIVAFGGVNFATYGDYAVQVAVSSAEVASLPLVVVRPASA